VDYLERCRAAVTALRPGIPVVAMLPSVHRAAVYGGVHAGRAAAERATRVWAAAHGVQVLDVPTLVAGHVLGGHGNPDGMHWGWEAHQRVGETLAELVRGELEGRHRPLVEGPGGRERGEREARLDPSVEGAAVDGREEREEREEPSVEGAAVDGREEREERLDPSVEGPGVDRRREREGRLGSPVEGPGVDRRGEREGRLGSPSEGAGALRNRGAR
jgi:hypothetical protein